MKNKLSLLISALLSALSLQAQTDYSNYFTAVFVADPHVAQSSGTSVADMQAYVQNIVNMGKTGGLQFQFVTLPGYQPKADIVFCLGDMDQDSEKTGNDFKSAFAGLNTAHIPFITMVGNHDIVPDYWTGTDPDYGLTGGSAGGSTCNDVALGVVTDQLNTAKSYGIENVTRFTDGTNHTQMQPFTFTFQGVRFYVGQTYWFQKPYSGSFIKVLGSLISSATYYAPDGVIAALEDFVGQHTTEPSVWMQHYPICAGDDSDRWWLDQNDTGMSIAPSDATAYTTANAKRDKLTELIKRTKNAVHFSGHGHWYNETEYNGVKDYTANATFNENGSAYIVLMSKTEGVVEVKEVNLFTHNTLSHCDAAAAVTPTLTDINTALGHTVVAGEDVTSLLGTNLDFETAQGDANATFVNMHSQSDWTNIYSADANDTNRQYIFNTQITGQGSGATTATSLRLRAKWQENNIREQVRKTIPLPPGRYTLSYFIKAPQQHWTEDLCFYEINGNRTTLTKTTDWSKQEITIEATEPAVLSLSFGFIGGRNDQDCELFIDDISLTYLGGADLASKYSKYLFAYFPSNSDENVYYAVSENGFDYTPISQQPVISADTVALKRGLRDPHLLRGHDGWFYLVATDMKSSEGWASNRGLVMMKSRDLVNWKHSQVHFPTRYLDTSFANVTRVWAPETIWDPEAGKYMVYFSLLTNDGTISYDKVYRAYANSDFTDLDGEPVWMYDRGSATIDMDIVYNPKDQLYHGFYKNEGQGGICQVTAASLTGVWGNASGTLQQTNEAVEGAGVFQLLDGETWVLMYDCYNSGHYQFCTSTDLNTFTFRQNTPTTGAFTPRHGSVILISDEEYEAIMEYTNNELERNTKLVAGATKDHPLPAPFVINGRMNEGTKGWSFTTGAQNKTTATNQGAAFSKPFLENWNPTSFIGKISQTITNIPNGTYALDIAAFANTLGENGSQVVYANSTELPLISSEPTAYQLVFYVSDNTLEIGFNQKVTVANWVGIDNVFLTYYGSDNNVEEVADQLLRQPLVDEIKQAVSLGADVADAQTIVEQDDLTRHAVEEAVKELKVKEFEAVVSDYTDDQTSLLGEWTTSNQTINQSQHWDGTNTSTYFEQSDGWGSYSWEMSMEQTVTLPAGDYVLKMAGRSASQAVTATMSVDDKNVRFPYNDDHGYGISTDGLTNFSPDATYANNGAGRGWEWRYIAFTLNEETTIPIAIHAICDQAVNQWVSFTNISLLRKPVMPGDVNGDGSVDIADVTSLVNYLMDQTSQPFTSTAADLNVDGEVTIADLPLLVGLVLAKESGRK